MGEVREEITLLNSADVEIAERGLMPQKDVRKKAVIALVDTGAITLVINEKLRAKLGLRVMSNEIMDVAGGGEVEGHYTSPVTIRWKGREMICQALVLPDEKETLLGLIPLEGMDLVVNPKEQRLVGKHGKKPVFRAGSVRPASR